MPEKPSYFYPNKEQVDYFYQQFAYRFRISYTIVPDNEKIELKCQSEESSVSSRYKNAKQIFIESIASRIIDYFPYTEDQYQE